MKLLRLGPSPYVRKVLLTAALKGVGADIEVVSPDDPACADLAARNPLGKIPVLFTDEGEALYDSHVICEYLDSLGGEPVLFPREGAARWRTLTLASMGDGMLDAALLLVYEGRYRTEAMRVQSWIDMQQAKIDTALGQLEAAPPAWDGHPDYGHITIACALGYLDFRHEGRWRAGHPNLVQWVQQFDAAVPAYSETTPRDL